MEQSGNPGFPGIKAFPHIRFAYKSSELGKETKTYLKGVLALLKSNPRFGIQISAHTDQTGTTQNNQQLSEQRAAIVAQYFEKNGIAANRLKAKGLGATQPLATGNNAQNRRVELTILKLIIDC